MVMRKILLDVRDFFALQGRSSTETDVQRFVKYLSLEMHKNWFGLALSNQSQL